MNKYLNKNIPNNYNNDQNIKLMCFEWKLNNSEVFEFINAANNQVFITPFFEMYSFKWYLKFIPFIKAKHNYTNTTENYSRLYICLASQLKNISNISLKRNEMILNKITFQVSIHMFEVSDKDKNIITDPYVDDSKTEQDFLMVNHIKHQLDAKDDYVCKIMNFEDSIDSPLFDHPLGLVKR